MLDIKFIRENRDLIQAGAIKKHIDFDIKKLLEVDDQRKVLVQEIDKLRTEQNALTEKIPTTADEAEKNKIVEQSKVLKIQLHELEERMKKVMLDWKVLMLQVPNIPDMSVPEGASDEDNQEIKTWGEKTKFDFEPKDHIEIMNNLDMVDFERGAKIHGFRGYYLKNDGVTLSMAVWQYALDFWTKKGFTPMIVPAIVKKEYMYGTGYLPNDADDIYRTQDGDYLTGTAEVAMTSYYADEVIDLKNGSKKFLAFSPPFRREAGSYGKDTKGLIRVHEFYKWEQMIFCEPNHEISVKHHEEIEKNTEEFIESLGVPYRTVVNCGGDLGQGQVKKYDIELWVPMEEKYREISSASYFHDFQARRLNIKSKGDDGKLRYVHTLNNTAIPTPRILVSLVENFQQADGSIKIPEPLQKYMNKDIISKEK